MNVSGEGVKAETGRYAQSLAPGGRVKEGKGFGRKEIREESGGMIARGIGGEKEAAAKRKHRAGEEGDIGGR